MSGICDTCMTAGNCVIRRDGRKLCAAYERNSNYNRLFGTPERAARTLANVCQFSHGGELRDRCQCYLFGECNRKLRLKSERSIYDALLEWLRGDAE